MTWGNLASNTVVSNTLDNCDNDLCCQNGFYTHCYSLL